jgi:methyl-accepting chemotaxis protein
MKGARVRLLFFHRTIARRLSLIVLAMALGLLVTVALAAQQARAALFAAKAAETRRLVEVAAALAADYRQRAAAGDMTEEAARRAALSGLSRLRYDRDGYFWVNDMAGTMLMHPTAPQLVGTNVLGLQDAAGGAPFRAMIDLVARQQAGALRYMWPPDGRPRLKQSYVAGVPGWNWVIGSGVFVDDVQQAATGVALRIAAAAAITLGAALAVALRLGRSISRPIGALTAVMQRLAQGDTAVAIPACACQDEIAAMAATAQVFKDSMATAQRLALEVRQAHAATQTALLGMADAIEGEAGKALRQVHERTAAMAATATDMSGSATRTGRAAETASSAAAQALATSQTVAGAAEELAASIAEIGQQVNESAAVAGRAVSAGRESRASIEALNARVSRIGTVVEMISDIAAKTNLLALNATIEAARAGTAGKGFAVVAGEVKSLAAQTAHSTAEIGRHIAEIRAATTTAVTAVSRIEQTIDDIHSITGGVAAAMEKQAAATTGIAFNVADTAAAAQDMSQRAADVSAEAEQTERHAHSVRENATGLEQSVVDLRHAIIQVIRTSTADVDRRADPRHPVDLPCEVSAAGTTQAARLIDLSAAGAQIRDAPKLASGTGGTLALAGLGRSVAFTVCDVDDRGALHVAFQADAAARAEIAALLQRLSGRQAA